MLMLLLETLSCTKTCLFRKWRLCTWLLLLIVFSNQVTILSWHHKAKNSRQNWGPFKTTTRYCRSLHQGGDGRAALRTKQSFCHVADLNLQSSPLIWALLFFQRTAVNFSLQHSNQKFVFNYGVLIMTKYYSK